MTADGWSDFAVAFRRLIPLRNQAAHDLPVRKVCSHCDKPAIGWFWSKDQGYVGWCRDHVDRQTIEAT